MMIARSPSAVPQHPLTNKPVPSFHDGNVPMPVTPVCSVLPTAEGDSESKHNSSTFNFKKQKLILVSVLESFSNQKPTLNISVQTKEQNANKLPVTDLRAFFDKRRKPKITSSKWVAKKCKTNIINLDEYALPSSEDEATIQLPERISKQLDDAKRRGIPLITIDEDPAFKYMNTEYHLSPSHAMRIKVFACTELVSEYHLKQQILFLGVKIKFPLYWDTRQTHTCEFFELSHTTKEFQDIQESLLETLPSAQITSIQRVQNLFLQAKYYTELCYLSNKNDGNCNQKYLFHGTRGTDPKEILRSQEGFDSRLSSKTNLWGPGIYFAEEAKYADGFAFRTGTQRQLILASVALGIYFDYEKLCNPTLTTPPMNIETKKYYDSVSGITRDSRVYTIFNSYQSCPRYLISYSIKEPSC